MENQAIGFYRYHTVIVGSGAAGYNAALRLYEMGQRDIAIVTEGKNLGTSRNTGSDKQTYYKLSLGGRERDSVEAMARTLFEGGCVDGDIAYAEAAGSVRSFFHLVELGVPFPTNECGEYVGYKTDHDPLSRGTSAGPYTSKYMTQALEKRAQAYGIPIHDRHLAVKLLTSDGGKRACGVMTLDQSRQGFCVFAAQNVIWATGGEAGMYKSSVYPYGQSGGSGVLFEAGALGKNLTESQYGIASTRFRWNLSGSFQQALPRYLSANPDGSDEREFLMDTFQSAQKMINAVFLKGYQWPFDPRKIEGEGSSLIDVLIYQEEFIKGRRIYIDYTRNPAVLEPAGKVDFSILSQEAEEYLRNCHALLETPFERLRAINPAAIQVYLDHGIDLSADRVEISVCAQHNNGGIAADCWWESGISHLFPVGEVNGSHGVYRPGGSALNAGQVGGLRAAERITHRDDGQAPEREEFLSLHEAEIAQVLRFAQGAAAPGPAIDVAQELDALRRRMSRFGAFIRSKQGAEEALRENRRQWSRLKDSHALSDLRLLPALFRLRDLLTAQYVYLEAIADYIRHSGVSRSSYLIHDPQGELPHEGIDECFRSSAGRPENGMIQEIRYRAETETCETAWRPVRPMPQPEQWFERAWRKFKAGEFYR